MSEAQSSLVRISQPEVHLLIEAVQIPSLSGEEGTLAAFLVRWAQDHGYTRAYVDEAGNAVAEMGSDQAPRTLVLLGHMDTVPGNIPVRIQDGKLYGRGTVDAKGPLCAFLAAVANVGPLPDVRFVVVGATEEEAATSRGARFIRDRFLAEGIPTGCIIGEPSGWAGITLGYKGRLLIDFVAKQPALHTAAPDARGVADRFCQWWAAVKAYCDSYNRDKPRTFDQILPSLREVHTSTDGLTDQVQARVGLRLPLEVSREGLEAQVRTMAEDVGGEVAFFGYEPAFRADKHNALVRALTFAIRQMGGRPSFKLKTGTSDMNVVGPAWQCPMVAYGPGDSRLDHTPEEHIELEEYMRGIRVLELALRRWATTPKRA